MFTISKQSYNCNSVFVCYNLFNGDTMKKNKGFTLVELLAVIVILAIIMIIAIPAVLNTMTTAKRKSFVEYGQKVAQEAEKKYALRDLEGLPSHGVIVYDITKELGLPSTGSFKGYVLVDATDNNSRGIYVYLYDDTYLFDIIKDTELKDESISSVNGVELITSAEEFANSAGYETYYPANSSSVIETVNGKYEFLESITLDGTKYINTNVLPTDNTKVEITIDNTDFAGMIGSRTRMNASDSYVIFIQIANRYMQYFIYWSNATENKSVQFSSITKPLKLTFDNKVFKVNDEVITTLEPTNTISAKYPMFLFTVNNSGYADNRIFRGTFYSCKIYEGNTLIRNFTPVKKKSTGEYLIYDKVEKKEYSFINYG